MGNCGGPYSRASWVVVEGVGDLDVRIVDLTFLRFSAQRARTQEHAKRL